MREWKPCSRRGLCSRRPRRRRDSASALTGDRQDVGDGLGGDLLLRPVRARPGETWMEIMGGLLDVGTARTPSRALKPGLVLTVTNSSGWSAAGSSRGRRRWRPVGPQPEPPCGTKLMVLTGGVGLVGRGRRAGRCIGARAGRSATIPISAQVVRRPRYDGEWITAGHRRRVARRPRPRGRGGAACRRRRSRSPAAEEDPGDVRAGGHHPGAMGTCSSRLETMVVSVRVLFMSETSPLRRT